MKNKFVLIDLIGISILFFFLFHIFKDADFGGSFNESVGSLFKVLVIIGAYAAGKAITEPSKVAYKSYLKMFYVVGVLSIISWATLGTHTEDSDPLFGGGNAITDFVPKDTERSRHALVIFLTFLTPAIYGVYKKREEIERDEILSRHSNKNVVSAASQCVVQSDQIIVSSNNSKKYKFDNPDPNGVKIEEFVKRLKALGD
jgi:hypothetical protein